MHFSRVPSDPGGKCGLIRRRNSGRGLLLLRQGNAVARHEEATASDRVGGGVVVLGDAAGDALLQGAAVGMEDQGVAAGASASRSHSTILL